MRRWLLGLAAVCTLAGLGLAGAAAQTTGGTDVTGAGGPGHTSVKTEGSGRPAPAGSSAGGVSATPVIGSGANGNGGVMTGTTGTAPAESGSALGVSKPTAGQRDGVASGKAPP